MMPKDDIDDLLGAIFSNGKLNLNPVVKPTGAKKQEPAQVLQQNMEDIAAMNESVRRELEELDQNIRKDGLSSSVSFSPAVDVPRREAVFAALAETIKKHIIGQDAFVEELAKAFESAFLLQGAHASPRAVLVVTGAAGSGRTAAVETACAALRQAGLWQESRPVSLDLSAYPSADSQKVFVQDLYTALESHAPVLIFTGEKEASPAVLRMVGELAMQGEVALSGRYTLQKGMLVEIGTALVPHTVRSLSCEGRVLVFETEQSAQQLAGLFGAGFLQCVSAVCHMQPFSQEALAQLARRQLDELVRRTSGQLSLTLTVDASLENWLTGQFDKEYGVPSLQKAADVLFRAVGEAKLHSRDMKSALLTVQDGQPVLQINDAQSIPLLKETPAQDELAAVRAQLQQIVGLEPVKDYILSLEETCRVNEMRRARGLKTTPISMHMIFTGNPGTGKTTIARLIARYLKAIGALSEGQLVEVTRADLVGKYVGHTAPLTMQAVRAALGGVLFIDEAYSLCRGQDDTFGLEAIDTLVKAMEDYRDNLVVILAGYSREMKQFLQANSGLRSRFPNQIEFPDYTGEELTQIACSLARERGYRIDETALKPLTAYFSAVQAADARTGGNGRLARNVVEDAVLSQSRRILRENCEDLETLLPADFDVLSGKNRTPQP